MRPTVTPRKPAPPTAINTSEIRSKLFIAGASNAANDAAAVDLGIGAVEQRANRTDAEHDDDRNEP